MKRKGFSLVELMIVVAIIGILAVIAIPSFITAQLRAKRAEATTNLRGIEVAQLAYDATFDGYVHGASNPGGTIDKTARAFNTSMAGWSSLGWKPDGLIRCSYVSNVLVGSPYLRLDALCDVDNDNQTATIRRYAPTGRIPGYFYDLDRNEF